MRKVAFLLMIPLLFVASMAAQSPNAIINGVVLDPSGAAIVGAEVVVVNDATGVQYTTRTNEEGIYVLPNVPPGPYRIQVSNSGFKTIIKPNIVIHVQDALAINFTLPVGAASEIVTVQGGAPLVNAENATVGTVIDRRFVENLPLNGRSFNTLLQLTPGVVIAPTRGGSPGQFSVAGQRTNANNFQIDGVSANFGVASTLSIGASGGGQSQAFSALGGTSSLVSVEALQEFRVETSSFAPEYGRSPGGQVILTTRAGTNGFHGGVYEYFRNNAMDANDWFANAAGRPRAAERHNDYGVYLGGPIRKDRTFFFVSYEGARLRLPQSLLTTVPSVTARTSAPATLAPLLDAFPLPNGPVSANGTTAQFTGSYSNKGTLDAGSIRLDHTLSSRFTIFGRYNNAPSQFVRRLNPVSDFINLRANTQTLTVGINMMFSNRLSNSVRANYSRQDSSLTLAADSFGGAVPLDPKLLLGSLSGANNSATFATFDTGFLTIGPNARNRATQLNFLDDLAVTLDVHQLKFGGDYRAIFLDEKPAQHTLNYLATSVQAFVSTETVNLSSATSIPSQVLTSSLSLYGQDSWKVSRRLTLIYGLRWDLSPAPTPRGNTTLAAWTNVNNPSSIGLAPAGTAMWGTDYTNFAPRIGIAYALTDKRDLVLRAGWGLFYDLAVGSSGDVLSQFPNVAHGFSTGVSMPVSDTTSFLPVISRQPPFPAGVEAFSPTLENPRSYQWNVSMEKSFNGRDVISATYVGQAGRNLLRRDDMARPNSNFSGFFALTTNSANSDYNALQLQYRRALAARIQALVNYTLSHSLDNASNDALDFLSNVVFSGQNDRGSSDFDIRQSFSGALTYSVPSLPGPRPLIFLTEDWSIAANMVARTGIPFNAGVLSFIVGNSRGQRPDLVPGQSPWISDPAAPAGKRLNPAAFSIPPVTRQGNEGRNDISGFGLTQIDVSLGRTLPFTERVKLQFRADAFNMLNHPNFLNPDGFVGSSPIFLQSRQMLNQGLGGLNPLFQEGGPRSLQLSLKLVF